MPEDNAAGLTSNNPAGTPDGARPAGSPSGDRLDYSSPPMQNPESALSASPEAPTPPPPSHVPVHPHVNWLQVTIIAALFMLMGLVAGWFIRGSTIREVSEASTAITTEAKKEPIVIGGISALTGDAASYGVPIQQAAFLAQKEINAAGGIDGRQIEILWEDGRCESADAKAAAEKLVNVKQVEFLLGGVCSGEFLQSAPIAQNKKILVFSSSATSPKISELGDYVFRTAPSDALAGKVAAEYAYNKLKLTRAAVITEDKPYTHGLHEVFKTQFTALGGTVVADEVFATGTTDFGNYARKIKEAKPDFVYILPQTSSPGVLVVLALKNTAVEAKLLTAEVLLIRDAIQQQAKVLEGVTGIEAYHDETQPKYQHLAALYKKEYNIDPPYPAFMAGMYDIIYLIKEAYEKVGSDPDKIAEYLYSIKNWEGAVGPLEFDRHGDPSFNYSIRTISNGEAPLIEVYAPTTTSPDISQ